MLKFQRLFESFFMGGFECSTHRLPSGKRLDEVAATAHDRLAREDYLRLDQQGMRTAREGLRWHLIEPVRSHYTFASALPLVRAARQTRTQIIWDLFHYGYPDRVDLFRPDFVDVFAQLARAFARFLANESDDIPFVTPLNEISFFSWAAAEKGI